MTQAKTKTNGKDDGVNITLRALAANVIPAHDDKASEWRVKVDPEVAHMPIIMLDWEELPIIAGVSPEMIEDIRDMHFEAVPGAVAQAAGFKWQVVMTPKVADYFETNQQVLLAELTMKMRKAYSDLSSTNITQIQCETPCGRATEIDEPARETEDLGR